MANFFVEKPCLLATIEDFEKGLFLDANLGTVGKCSKNWLILAKSFGTLWNTLMKF